MRFSLTACADLKSMSIFVETQFANKQIDTWKCISFIDFTSTSNAFTPTLNEQLMNHRIIKAHGHVFHTVFWYFNA